MDTGSNTPASVSFGRFQVSPHRREFLADGRPVQIGGRAFDVLMALIDAQGAVVSKNALMERVWPDRIVEENNLQIQISALRAAFGSDRNLIRTVAGRGYQFTGEIRIASAGPGRRRGSAAVAREALPPRNVPEPVSELIGREDELRETLSFIQGHRLVTLTGPGGIGKTRLALAAARRLPLQFADGVWFAELAPLSEPTLVPAAVAAAVGLKLAAGEASADHVACALANKELLLFIDNCEHVIEGAGTMAEALLHANSAARVVATSREPLKAEGEWVYRVPPLTVPAPDVTNEDDLLRYGSVQLFIKRAQAVELHLVPDRHFVATVAAICRRLDGIPLAIELAASRIGALGIEQIAERLDDRFRLLAGGRRTALPRHQTMHATLEWSHELLTASERVLLHRLAVFAGVFDLDAAGAVATSPEMATYEVVDVLSNLVSKSLVDRNATGYRLLETIHAFGLEKLVESGELEVISRRHAEYHQNLFERAECEWETRAADEWLAEYGPKIDDLRAALDWAFSPAGNPSLGVALTVAAVPLWMQLSLLQECRSRVERALSALDAGASRDRRREMKLRVALATSILYTRGRAHELGAVLTGALEIAEELSDRDYQLRSLRGLQIFYSSSDFRKTLEIAKTFCLVAEQQPDKNDRLIGDVLMGASEHFLGDQTSARAHIERMLANFSAPDHRSHSYAGRLQFDQHVMPRLILARILWLQGFPNQAMRTAEDAVQHALEANHAISTCNVLCHAACPIALWMGDFALADRHVRILLDHARRSTLPLLCELARMFEALLAVSRGDVVDGLGRLCAGFDESGESLPPFDHVKFQSDIAETLGRAGQIADGLTVAEQAIERCELTNERWLFAELLRIKGDLMLRKESAAAKAEDSFREALDWARRQGALSWELRAATSLARLLRDQRRCAEAIAVIKPVYDRFTEGFDTTDLVNAKALIEDLH
jgi:predicted ATPase/DNA-binding winged helix-turn-helix (wHTH) protein